MAVNEHRPAVADVKFDVKEGSSICSATFIFGYVRNLNLDALSAPALLLVALLLQQSQPMKHPVNPLLVLVLVVLLLMCNLAVW